MSVTMFAASTSQEEHGRPLIVSTGQGRVVAYGRETLPVWRECLVAAPSQKEGGGLFEFFILESENFRKKLRTGDPTARRMSLCGPTRRVRHAIDGHETRPH